MELFLVLIAYSFNYFANEMFPLKYECGNYIKMAPPRRSSLPSSCGGWRTGRRWRTRRGTTWTSGTLLQAAAPAQCGVMREAAHTLASTTPNLHHKLQFLL